MPISEGLSLVFAVPPNTVAAPARRDLAHPVRIAREHAQARHTWSHLLRYDPRQRWAALLERTEDQETWLLSWLPGQHTDPHDHGIAVGAFTIVAGTLTERVLRDDEIRHTLHAGQSRVFGPGYVHQVRNDGPDPAISVHVYRPARDRTMPHPPLD